MQFSSIKTVIFYEKTGCSGNARQKALLKEHGIVLDVRSLLDTPWDTQTLERFFEGLSVEEMINPFAPQRKDGSFDSKSYTKEQLIQTMIKEPILIRRPLLQIGEARLCGFDIPTLNRLLKIDMPTPEHINACLSSDACNKA